VEQVTHCTSYEEARNEALRWMENEGGPIGPYFEIEIGRIGLAERHEVGVSSTVDPYRRIRLDYDPGKGPHFNAEVGKGRARLKHAFTFPGDEKTIASHLRTRQPRG
jgi:hypothetical protein